MIANAESLIPYISNEIEISNSSQDHFVLINKRYRHYLKITKEISDLISIVDGKLNLRELSVVYAEKFDILLSVDFIYGLLYEKLSAYGVVAGFEDNIKILGKPAYLKLSFILINEKLLNKFTRYLYFLFNLRVAAGVLLTSVILLTVEFTVHISRYSEFNIHHSLLYFFALGFISVSFHEVGHASAANFFGVKHGGIGGGFYLFTPVYFADVTDIWRLPKNQRIVVNLAGMYFEMFLSAILILTSYLIQSPLLGVFSALICMKTFTNLNPLIRSDGYWVLADLSNKPNLRTDALNKIKELCFFVLKKKKFKWSYADLSLFVYALISYAFVGYFLYYVLIKNPDSIIYFPKNLVACIKVIFSSHPQFSFRKYGELLVPVLFFYLLFNLCKEPAKIGFTYLKRLV